MSEIGESGWCLVECKGKDVYRSRGFLHHETVLLTIEENRVKVMLPTKSRLGRKLCFKFNEREYS